MILILCHEATYTGAPIVMLNICKWMKREKGEEFVFVFVLGGPLLAEYEKLGKVYVFEPEYPIESLYRRIINRISGNTIHKYRGKIIDEILFLKPDLIISNTIVNGKELKLFEGKGIPIISIIHELESVIRLYESMGRVSDTLRLTDHFIAVSGAVKQNLIVNHGVPEKRISIVYESIPALKEDKGNAGSINEKKQGKFMAGGCGNLIFRKGPDLFIRVADEIVNKRNVKDISFIWVGGNKNSSMYIELSEEIRKLGLSKHVHLTGETQMPREYYTKMDVFLMCSREDPFPLVNIEAAQHGLPVICFEGTGGSAEFVKRHMGYAVPYLDTNSMADKILELKNKEELRSTMSANARMSAAEYTTEKKAAELYKIIISYKRKGASDLQQKKTGQL